MCAPHPRSPRSDPDDDAGEAIKFIELAWSVVGPIVGSILIAWFTHILYLASSAMLSFQYQPFTDPPTAMMLTTVIFLVYLLVCGLVGYITCLWPMAAWVIKGVARGFGGRSR